MNAMKYLYGDEPLEKQKIRFRRQLNLVRNLFGRIRQHLDNMQSDMSNAIDEGSADKEAVENWKIRLHAIEVRYLNSLEIGQYGIKSWLKLWGFMPEVDPLVESEIDRTAGVILINEAREEYEFLNIDPKLVLKALKLLKDESVDKALKGRKEK